MSQQDSGLPSAQLAIDGLRHGGEALDVVLEYAKTTLEGMADLGDSERYRKLLEGFKRLHELRLSVINLRTVIELEGMAGLWQPGRGEAQPKGDGSNG